MTNCIVGYKVITSPCYIMYSIAEIQLFLFWRAKFDSEFGLQSVIIPKAKAFHNFNVSGYRLARIQLPRFDSRDANFVRAIATRC